MNGVEILEFQKKSLKELEVHPSSGTIGFGV